jgi:hypothetical protein
MNAAGQPASSLESFKQAFNDVQCVTLKNNFLKSSLFIDFVQLVVESWTQRCRIHTVPFGNQKWQWEIPHL